MAYYFSVLSGHQYCRLRSIGFTASQSINSAKSSIFYSFFKNVYLFSYLKYVSIAGIFVNDLIRIFSMVATNNIVFKFDADSVKINCSMLLTCGKIIGWRAKAGIQVSGALHVSMGS